MQLFFTRGVNFRQWEASNPSAIFMLIHGLGAHSARWEFLAQFLQARGFSAYAIELQGFGETVIQSNRQSSAPPPVTGGHIDTFQTYDRDLKTLYQIIKEKNPRPPIFIIGESMGALIALNFSAKNQSFFRGTILMSPAFKNNLKFSGFDYFKIVPALLLKPTTLFKLPFTSSMCTQDSQYQTQMDADPREIRVASAKLLFNILRAQAEARRRLKDFSLPILFLLSGNDFLVQSAASKKLFGQLNVKDKKLIEYPKLRHALYIEKDREKVFNDLLMWVKSQIGN